MRCRGLGRKRRIFREICVAGEEIFRGIGFVARDANWGTPALSAAPRCDDADGRTRIESAGELTTTTGDLTWSVIRSVVDRVIEARVEATSREGFPTNRTGFVVLHSLGASRGQRVRVTHPDGAVAAAEFPQLVSGNSPSLRSLRWSMKLCAGYRLRLSFEGEVFEIDYQRNWTDASYKTYCRPLHLPIYRIAPGEKVVQRLRLELLSIGPAEGKDATRGPSVGAAQRVPMIGKSPAGAAARRCRNCSCQSGAQFHRARTGPCGRALAARPR